MPPAVHKRFTIYIWTITILLLLMATVIGLDVQAQLPTDVEKTSAVFGFDKIINDTGWNAQIATPLHIGKLDGYAAGILQSGNLIRGKYHIEIGTNIGAFGIRAITAGTLKGYTLDTLGRESRFGLGIETPPVNGASIRVAVFGKNAGEWGPPNARQTLEGQGYDPNSLDEYNLETLHPPPTGIPFKTGNSLELEISTNFEWKGISIGIKGMPELTGEGDPAHQGIISAHISKEITKNIFIDLGAEFGIQSWQGNIDKETAYFIGTGIYF